MRTFILLIMAALAGVTCRAQEPKPEGGVRILTAGQHITPYRIGVPFSKTVHILFPSEVRYVDRVARTSSRARRTAWRTWCA